MTEIPKWVGQWTCPNCKSLIIAAESSASQVLGYGTEKKNGLTVESLRVECPCCMKIVEMHRPEVTVTFSVHARIWEWLAETYGYPEEEVRGMVERWYADEMANEESSRVSER